MAEVTNRIRIVINAEAQAAIERFTELIKRVGEFAIAIAGLHGLKNLAEDVLKLGRALNNLHNRTGGAIQDLVAIRRLLQESGGSAEEVGTLLTRMQKSLVDAAEQGGAAGKIFAELKINLAELLTKNATDQFEALGKAIGSIENPAKRAQAVLAIFGRGGGDLVTVFSNPERFLRAFADESLFGSVMARNAELFDEIEINLNRLANNGKKFMAGVLDQIAPLFEGLADVIGRIDLTAIGQKVGAFVSVIVQAARDGKLPEMIGLLIEAGFELGAAAIKNGWLELLKALEFLTSARGGEIWTALINGIMTFGVRATQFLIKVLQQPIVYMAAGFEVLYSNLRVGFEKIVEFMKQNLAAMLNWFIGQWNKLAATSLGKRLGLGPVTPIQTAPADIEPATTFTSALEHERKTADDVLGGTSRWLEKQLQDSRSILKINEQITASDDKRKSAVQRLSELINEQVNKRAAEAHVEEATILPLENKLMQMREQERILKEKLLVIEESLADIESDFRLTDTQKYALKQQLLAKQRETLQDVVKLLRAQAEIEDATTRQGLLSRADTFEKQLGQNRRKANEADPNNLLDQLDKKATELSNRLGTLAQNLASTVIAPFEGLFNGLTKAIDGLIMGTLRWGQALKQVGTSIVTEIVGAFAKMVAGWITALAEMVVRYVAAKLTMFAVDSAINSKGQAQATQTAAVSGVAGVSKAGEQGGWVGILIYLAVWAAAVAAILAAVGAFAEGGRPPVGQASIVGERGPELFVPDRPGTIIPNHHMDSFLAGRGSQSSGSSPAASSPNVNIEIGAVMPEHAENWLRSGEGDRFLVDWHRRNRHKLT